MLSIEIFLQMPLLLTWTMVPIDLITSAAISANSEATERIMLKGVLDLTAGICCLNLGLC